MEFLAMLVGPEWSAEFGIPGAATSIRMGFDGDTWWQGLVFDGELFLRDGDTEGDGGLITVDDDELTLTNGAGGWFTYSWSVDGDRFTLALLECVPQSGAGNCDDDIADVEFMTEHTYTSSGSDPTLAASASSLPVPLTLVVFGDSWPYGAHCDGCRAFPLLVWEGLRAKTGQTVEYMNLTTNGGTAVSLLADMRSSALIRAAITAADIIVISIGGNDIGPAMDATIAGECGGSDGLDCWRAVAETLRGAYDGILTEIDDLREGQSTAVRLVTNSNEFLFDPQLIEMLGEDYGSTEGVAITMMTRDVQCEVAASHGAACVELGPVLNGPDLLIPADVNSQDVMQAVADEILASGLDELG